MSPSVCSVTKSTAMASALNTVCSHGTAPMAVATRSMLPSLTLKAIAAHRRLQHLTSWLLPGEPSVAYRTSGSEIRPPPSQAPVSWVAKGFLVPPRRGTNPWHHRASEPHWALRARTWQGVGSSCHILHSRITWRKVASHPQCTHHASLRLVEDLIAPCCKARSALALSRGSFFSIFWLTVQSTPCSSS